MYKLISVRKGKTNYAKTNNRTKRLHLDLTDSYQKFKCFLL